MGIADVADTATHAWVAELLTNPTWGVVRYAKLGATKALYDDIASPARTIPATSTQHRSIRHAAHRGVGVTAPRFLQIHFNFAGYCREPTRPDIESGVTDDTRYFEYSKAANPIGSGHAL